LVIADPERHVRLPLLPQALRICWNHPHVAGVVPSRATPLDNIWLALPNHIIIIAITPLRHDIASAMVSQPDRRHIIILSY